MSVEAKISSGRLYGIEFRPQEFDLYAEHLAFDLRSAVMAEDPEAVGDRHWRLCVLEAMATIPAGEGIAGGQPRRMRVLRCGWEIELVPTRPCTAQELTDDPAVTTQAVERIAETVNHLAAKAGFASEPLTAETVTTLLHRFQTAPSD